MLNQWRNGFEQVNRRFIRFVAIFFLPFAVALIPTTSVAASSTEISHSSTGNYCRGNSGVQAVFWTMHPDGSQNLETKCISDDSVTGFMNYGTPPWHLNKCLTVFFQVPVYERQFGLLPVADNRTPV